MKTEMETQGVGSIFSHNHHFSSEDYYNEKVAVRDGSLKLILNYLHSFGLFKQIYLKMANNITKP